MRTVGRPLKLSEFDGALLDKLDREADALEQALHSSDSALLTKTERVALREALTTRYGRMAEVLNRQ